MGIYPIFIVNQLSQGPILALEYVNISFFLPFFLSHFVVHQLSHGSILVLEVLSFFLNQDKVTTYFQIKSVC